MTAILLGLTLAFEPKESGLMSMSPRDPYEPLVAQGMMKSILVVGLLLIWSVYIVFERALLRFYDLTVAHTAAVNAIRFGEIFFLIIARSFRHRLREIVLFSNKRLLGRAVIMVVLQLLFTQAGFMDRIFGTAPLGMGSWKYILTISLIIFLVVEFLKWFERQQTSIRSRELVSGAASDTNTNGGKRSS